MISYKPLLKLLVEKNLKKHDLIELVGLSTATIAKFSSGDYVSLEVIDRLCKHFDCQPVDLIVYIPGEKISSKNEKEG